MIERIKDFIRGLRVSFLQRVMLRKLEELPIPKGKVMVVAPHPDDETLGCGGLIARLVSNGNVPYVVIMTRGEGSHRGCCNIGADELGAARRGLALRALAILGVSEDHVKFLNYGDGGIPAHEDKGELEDLVKEIKPTAVFVPHWGEGWPDHLNTRLLVKGMVSLKADVYEYCVWMWYYNIWGLRWSDGYRMDLTASESEVKNLGVEMYVSEQAPCGKPWSGVLPELLVKACSINKELYFRCR